MTLFRISSRLIVIIALLAAVACEREERGFRVQTPDSNRINSKELTAFQAGNASPTPVTKNDYENNAFALSEGKQLFQQMNCVGCHAHGGGSIGPALIDDKWIYGNQPEQIFATIEEGRPNGMPAFHGKLPDYQVWEIAAYVRSLSGEAAKNAAPGRNDAMQAKTPENSMPSESPKRSVPPPQ